MKIVTDVVVPGRQGGAWVVKKDQRIRITDVEGSAIGDFVCFNANNVRERFSQARTKANQGRLMITTGHHLYSRDNNVLLSIVEDTYGIHDLQYGMCSAWVFANFANKDYQGFSSRGMRVGGPLGVPSFGCYEVLQKALAPWSIAPENIPDPLNLFQTLDYDFGSKTFKTVDGKSKPGDYIDFVARTDTLCGLSACPSMGRPLRVQVYDA
ncbi:MAG TPA: urea carboxylase-associated family protein [Alphaproteobacteria bacterium]|nr:urea carboxylase-associated family protein [Alphaproteobacteria bacterium]